LREVLEQGTSTLARQLQVDIVGDTLTEVEALLRWTQPTRGVFSPVEFMPMAEESGLIVPIGSWMLKRVCREASGIPFSQPQPVDTIPALIEALGKRAAVIMSLPHSVRINAHKPYAYLKDLLERLPMHPASRIDDLLPHRWTPATWFPASPPRRSSR
jgi:hypothetical protein